MTTTRMIVLLVFLLNTTTTSAQFTPSRGANPRRSADTWFEGWYTRITADNGEDAIGLVVGSYLRLRGSNEEPHRGYVAILKRNVGNGVLAVHEHFPEHCRVQSARLQSRRALGTSESVAFEWEADGIGIANESEIAIRLPNGTSLTASLCNRQPWQPALPWRGPEGMAERLRLLRCHWSVFSLASRVKFVLTTAGSSMTGTGFAHQETNWGEAFPKAYVWAQGCSPDGRNRFALAGGMLPIGHTLHEGWLLGLRTSGTHWDFRPQVPGTFFTTHVDSHKGQFSMTARSALRRVEIEVSADPATFTALAIPTRHGFAHDTVQSFSASAAIRAYRCGLTGGRTLVESLRIANAAIEFGGDYRPRLETP